MSNKSYSKELDVFASPESVYNAITNEIHKWWTEYSNSAIHVGDRLTVQFEKATKWVLVVSEAIENHSLVWQVVEADHNIDNLSKTDEWKGTTISWKIGKQETGCKIYFIHEGLTPSLECYRICDAGWEFFLGSLTSYLNNGKGNPYAI